MGGEILISIQCEPLKDFLDEMKGLLLKHYEEVHAFPDKIKFDPDYDHYLTLDDIGMLHCITARDNGVLVGYFISLISFNMHYKNDKYAVNDVLYLSKEYRGSSAAYRMFKFAEEEYKKLGVKVFTVHMKTKVPFDRLCESLGMERIESIYAKYIGE